MERKIGEIFEYNGEWYQVVECSKDNYPCIGCCGCKSVGGARINGGECNGNARNDRKFIIFKKLERVGEPFSCNYYGNGKLVIMQEYQLYEANAIYYHGSLPMYISDYKHKRIAIEIKRNEDMEDNKLNLKPFDLEKAKQGKPVCTRDGRKAVFLTTLSNKRFPVVAIVNCGQEENIYQYDINGICDENDDALDLMMLPEKSWGWTQATQVCVG